MKKTRVGILFGGRSGEHEVSVLSARSVMENIDRVRFDIVPIFIDRRGRWFIEEMEVYFPATPGFGGLLTKRSNKKIPIDIFFPVLHGTYGEDGTIQGLFEFAATPFVGTGMLGSTVGMDKELQKYLYEFHGIPTPRFEIVHAHQWEKRPGEIERKVARSISVPCFVKPVNLGSSVGITKVKKPGGLGKAINEALLYDRKAIIEEAIKGREIFCGVIGNEEIRVSLPGQVVPRREFYDYIAKYVDEGNEYKMAIPLPNATHDRVMNMAAAAYRACFCDGMARVDMFLTPTDEVLAIEINTIPGFTAHSIFPKAWEASGLPYKDLLTKVIDLGFVRWEKKRKQKTIYEQGKLLI